MKHRMAGRLPYLHVSKCLERCAPARAWSAAPNAASPNVSRNVCHRNVAVVSPAALKACKMPAQPAPPAALPVLLRDTSRWRRLQLASQSSPTRSISSGRLFFTLPSSAPTSHASIAPA